MLACKHDGTWKETTMKAKINKFTTDKRQYFMNTRKGIALLTIALSAMMMSCNGIADGIYEDVPSDNTFREGFSESGTANRYTLKIDATNYNEWVFVSLHDRTITRRDIPLELTGEWDGRSGITYNHVEGSKFTPVRDIRTDKQEEPDNWDIAFHHFDVRTNHGKALSTGIGNIDNLPASSESFSNMEFTPDKWSTTQAITDLKEMMNYVVGYQNGYTNPVLSAWMDMDLTSPPPVFTKQKDSYVVQLADGTHAAMSLDSYISPAGSKGMLTINIIYPY